MQERLIAESRGRQAEAPFSSGRGGAGNISTSRSRSRSKARHEKDDVKHEKQEYRAGGRGGYGNMTEKHAANDEDLGRVSCVVSPWGGLND